MLHEFAARAQFGDQIVVVPRVQDFEQLNNIGMTNHLKELRFATQILINVLILSRLLLVDHFDGNLNGTEIEGED